MGDDRLEQPDPGQTEQDAPLQSDQQEAPEPERPSTPEEEARVANRDLDEPPQAEGDREEEADDGGGRPA